MDAIAVVGYTTAGILSCGVSQVIGVTGLLLITIRTIYDAAMLSFHNGRLRNMPAHGDDGYEHVDHTYIYHSKQWTYYNNRLGLGGINVRCASAFAVALLPVAGFILSYRWGVLGESFNQCILDIAQVLPCIPNKVRSYFYPLEGQPLPAFDTLFDQPLTAKEKIALAGATRNYTGIRNSPALQRLFKDKYEAAQKKDSAQMPSIQFPEITTPDKRHLDAVWIQGAVEKEEKERKGEAEELGKTIILFHDSDSTLFSLSELARLCHNQGLNVLMVTVGGYPGSPQKVAMSEITNTLDAQAAIDYVNSLGVAPVNVFSYGENFGATLASAAASHFQGSQVIVDRPLINAGLHLIRRTQPGGSLDRLALSLSKLVFEQGLPILPLPADHEQVHDQTRFFTNGMDVPDRLSRVQGRTLVIGESVDVNIQQRHHSPIDYQHLVSQVSLQALLKQRNTTQRDLLDLLKSQAEASGKGAALKEEGSKKQQEELTRLGQASASAQAASQPFFDFIKAPPSAPRARAPVPYCPQWQFDQ